MTDIKFGRLEDLPLREAWKHEALQFTPWLAENIEHLSEAIGIPLELAGTEVAVETFSADILARNPMDDSTILIENQLEPTDHTHLGQIMTYLAGLEAQTVVWIAPSFREPHLSAIRWLNEHTADGFSFFAVKARVVRIGDSPFAPVFEIAEKPNGWERQIREKERKTRAPEQHSELRFEFWSQLAASYPDLERHGSIANRTWNAWVRLWEEPEINLSLFVGNELCGCFLRTARGGDPAVLETVLGPHAERILNATGASQRESSGGHHFAVSRLQKSYLDRANWPEMTAWMGMEENRFRTVIEEIMKDRIE
ncbi:hypothetical protein [Roseovarius indicus]|uniref:hypothetical protein n=1 Tax=Roseovarius indicus TaxID=540747 RepID=UPI0032F05BF7